jgi:hypothetical protein
MRKLTPAVLIALALALWPALGAGQAALSRLEMEQLRKLAGLDAVHIPYKGGAGPAVNGLLGGETHVIFVSLASVPAFIQAGRLKALGVSTAQRIDALPQVPTMTEAGFPEMVSGSWQGCSCPRGPPARSSSGCTPRSPRRALPGPSPVDARGADDSADLWSNGSFVTPAGSRSL